MHQLEVAKHLNSYAEAAESLMFNALIFTTRDEYLVAYGEQYSL
jgi:hypothetical protein